MSFNNLHNVFVYARASRSTGEVAAEATKLYYAAREVCAARGIDADEELREQGVNPLD